MKPLYAVTAVFNPFRFASRLRLYRDFAAWIRAAGVKLVTVEVAFGERPFEVTEATNPWHLQLRTSHVLWHKERALNLGLQRLGQLDPGWGYVAWVDCDVKLSRERWPEEAVQLLQHFAVLQMFGEARSLGPDHHTLYSARSIGRNFHDFGRMDWGWNPGLEPGDVSPYARRGHPGLAWAFRRAELNDVGGWLDVAVNGSADLHMAGCYSGDPGMGLSPHAAPGYRAAVLKYGELCRRYVRRNVSYLPGAADHYYHGPAKQRGYDQRWKLVDKYQFDPHTDLIADCQGLWKWNLADPRVHALAADTRRSLSERNEDATG